MKKTLILVISLVCILTVQISLIGVGEAQWAQNAERTLYGENRGDHILLQFSINDSATEYIVYRSTSLTGPWQVNGRFTQGAAITGAGAMEFTPDASLMDLCYKVEALDATGIVIRTYSPICVPKFVP